MNQIRLTTRQFVQPEQSRNNFNITAGNSDSEFLMTANIDPSILARRRPWISNYSLRNAFKMNLSRWELKLGKFKAVNLINLSFNDANKFFSRLEKTLKTSDNILKKTYLLKLVNFYITNYMSDLDENISNGNTRARDLKKTLDKIQRSQMYIDFSSSMASIAPEQIPLSAVKDDMNIMIDSSPNGQAEFNNVMHSMQHPEPINSELQTLPLINPVEPPLNVREGIEYQMGLEQSLRDRN